MDNLRKLVDKILGGFLILLMTVLVIDVLWQVISRYVMSSPSSFTDELAGYLLSWVGLIGAAYVTGIKGHLAIDLLLQKTHDIKRKRFLEVIINLVILAFALTVFVIGGSWLAYTRFVLGVESAAIQLPLGYVYLSLPISGLLICYYAIDNLRLEKTEN